jgi:hypothetical protein
LTSWLIDGGYALEFLKKKSVPVDRHSSQQKLQHFSAVFGGAGSSVHQQVGGAADQCDWALRKLEYGTPTPQPEIQQKNNNNQIKRQVFDLILSDKNETQINQHGCKQLHARK